jgi:hypothetical protein
MFSFYKLLLQRQEASASEKAGLVEARVSRPLCFSSKICVEENWKYRLRSA